MKPTRSQNDSPAFPVRPQPPVRPLITAEEAYPALERAVAEATDSIWLAYRVFEPWTTLVSEAGRALGSDWTELLRAKLRQGVQVRIMISDFDAVGGTDLHENCWRCLRALSPLWEHGDFAALPVLHMSGAGWFWRVALWPLGIWRIAHFARRLNRQPPAERQSKIALVPGLWNGLRVTPDGRARPKPAPPPGLYPATYHQKFAVIDHTFAMVGGLDINDRRYDDLRHMRPSNATWADVAVTTEGPLASDLGRHFVACWEREAPRQLARTRTMHAHAPRGFVLPPMPTEAQAPCPPGRQRQETGEQRAQADEATVSSPADPGGGAHRQDRGGDSVNVARSKAEAKGETVSRGSPLGRATRLVPDEIQNPAPGAVESERGTAQVLRTVSGQPRGRGLFRLAPKTMLDEIERGHLKLIGRARKLIYIETQFLRKRRIVDALVRAGRSRPDLKLIVVVPAAPMEVAFDGKRSLFERLGEHLQAHGARRLRRAFGRRVVLIAPLRPVPHRPDYTGTEPRAGAHGAEMIFVHTKVMTVDDDAAIAGSANLNGRSLRWDIEVSLMLEGGEAPAALRRRLFSHWLPEDAPEAAYGLDTAVEAWREIAIAEVGRPPAQRQSFIAPYAAIHARRFGRAVPGVPEDFI